MKDIGVTAAVATRRAGRRIVRAATDGSDRTSSLVRQANDHIRRFAEIYGFDGPIHVICECAGTTCEATVAIERHEYEAVRALGLVIAPTHQQLQIERIVARGRGYYVVEEVLRRVAA